MTGLLNEVRYGARRLIGRPGPTVLALVTLALGIGANTAIFRVVYGVLLAPLPCADSERLVQIWKRPPGFDLNGISTLNLLNGRAQNRVFDFIVAHVTEPVTFSGARLRADRKD